MRKNSGYHAILGACALWTIALAGSTSGDLKVAVTSAPNQAAGTSANAAASFRSGVPGSPQAVQSMETPEQAAANSAGCITCHTRTDEASMHPSGTVTLGCTTCHGGDANVSVAAGLAAGAPDYIAAKKKAHPQSRVADIGKSSANPVRPYTEWLRESEEYIQFVNPGDLRVADKVCGRCHAAEVRNVRTSMMTHGRHAVGGGALQQRRHPVQERPLRRKLCARRHAAAAAGVPRADRRRDENERLLPFLDPLPRWEVSQPGNVLRVFERGGSKKGEVGNPTRNEDPGHPDVKLSDRGFGTELRTDPVFLGLQKTRLLDPMLSFPGTNDQPGDYRGSGCTACHVIYANDRSPEHSCRSRSTATTGTDADGRSDDRSETRRVGPSDQARRSRDRFRRASA